MRHKQAIAAPITLDADGIAEAQTPAGAGDLTLDGVGVATHPYMDGYTSSTRLEARLSPPRRVSITSDGDDSGVTFTVYGRDRAGMEINETITGPNTATVSTTKIFAAVTRIAISAAGTGSIEAGWTATSHSRWVPIGQLREDFQSRIRVLLGGTATFSLQGTSMPMANRAIHGEGDATAAPDYTGGEHPDDIFDIQASGASALNLDIGAPYQYVRLEVTAQNAPVTLRVLHSILG